MSTPQFVDISSFQGNIDFAAYAAWARQGDGIARIAIKATEGVGFTDPSFSTNRAKALAAGIDSIIYYHFARPDLSNNPMAEADFLCSVVGNIRASDMLVLDYEVTSPYATAEWAYEWLHQQEANYTKLPGIYASTAYIQQRLQDSRLSKYPIWLANWQYTPDERPSCPPPWTSYQFVQYSDKATIPGIAGIVDANIFLGAKTTMTTQTPTGWQDDGTTLTAPNGHHVIQGFRDYILQHSNWDPQNVPLEDVEAANPVEDYYNQAVNGGTRQMFLYDELAWTQARGVYVVGIGNELLGCRKERDSLKAEVAALKALPSTTNLAQINTLATQATATIAKIGTLSQLQ